MKLSDKQWEFLQDVAKLIIYAESCGYKLTGGELQRTLDQQKIYAEKGLSKTLNSRHLKKLAIDLNLFLNDEPQWEVCPEWEILGDYWESLRPENTWGGRWGWDPRHFERSE